MGDFLFGHGDAGCSMGGENIKSDGRDFHRLQRVTARIRRVGSYRFNRALLERARHIVPTCWLNNGNLGVRENQRSTGCQPTPTAADNAAIRRTAGKLGHLLDRFQRRRPLPFNNPGIIEAGHDNRAAFCSEIRCQLLATAAHAIIGHDLRAECARRIQFRLGRILRHDDQCWHAQPFGGPSNALRMIARGKSNDTGFAFLFSHRGEPMIAAAQFERTDRLQVFAFEPDTAMVGIERDQGRWRDNLMNTGCGFFDSGQCRRMVLLVLHPISLTRRSGRCNQEAAKIDSFSGLPQSSAIRHRGS